MLTVEDEVELAKSILESARVRKHFNREFEEIKEKVPCLMEIDDDRVSTAEMEGLSFIDFKKIVSVAKANSKLVFPLIDLLMVDRTGTKEEESSKERERDPTMEEIRCATALSTACYNRNQQCSGVQRLLGTYFRECGMKDAELEMLHRMGISASLGMLDSFKNKLEAQRKEMIKEIAQSRSPVVAYANFEPLEKHSVTNAIVFEGINMPKKGLVSQINAVEKVDTDDLLSLPSATIDSPTSKKIREVLIHWALEEAFPQAYKKKFGKKPQLPEISRLKPVMTKYAPLTTLMEDASTDDGTLAVIKDIYRKQLRDIPEKKFAGKLLVVGDQKSNQTLRTAKCYFNYLPDDRGYCDHRWEVPIPGLFRLKMHALKFICGKHYSGKGDFTKLENHASFLKYSEADEDARKFFEAEALCRQSYNSRVIALVLSGFKSKKGTNIENYFASLPRKDVQRSIDDLMSRITYNYIGRPEYPQELENHYAFLEYMEAYLILKYGVKFGDVGYIRAAVDRFLIYFNATKGRYAKEMIYFKFMIDSGAMETKGQDAILSNCLVNLSGRGDGWFEADRLVEILNGHMKEAIEVKKPSMQDLKQFMKQASSLAGPMINLKLGLRHVFGVSTHCASSAGPGSIKSLAEFLIKSGTVAPRAAVGDADANTSLYLLGHAIAGKVFYSCRQTYADYVIGVPMVNVFGGGNLEDDSDLDDSDLDDSDQDDESELEDESGLEDNEPFDLEGGLGELATEIYEEVGI